MFNPTKKVNKQVQGKICNCKIDRGHSIIISRQKGKSSTPADILMDIRL